VTTTFGGGFGSCCCDNPQVSPSARGQSSRPLLHGPVVSRIISVTGIKGHWNKVRFSYRLDNGMRENDSSRFLTSPSSGPFHKIAKQGLIVVAGSSSSSQRSIVVTVATVGGDVLIHNGTQFNGLNLLLLAWRAGGG
jgi:hypothetical protein